MTDLKIPAWIATSTHVKMLKEVRKRAEKKNDKVVIEAITARLAALRQPQEPQGRTVHINALKALGVGPFPMDGEALSEAAFYRKVYNQWGWSNTRIAREITGRPEGDALHRVWWNRVLNALAMAYLNGEVVPVPANTVEWVEQHLRPLSPEGRQRRWEQVRDQAPIQPPSNEAGEP